MQIIPTQAVANQAITVTLAGQTCQINVYQKLYGLFVDLYVADVLLVAGTPALNVTRIIRADYLGFSGDLIFIDTQGADDPAYTGLGSRFHLAYLEQSELIAA
jgi:hypothetical protein